MAEECAWYNPLCNLPQWVGDVASAGPLGPFIRPYVESMLDQIKIVGGMWTAFPTPGVSAGAPVREWVSSQTLWAGWAMMTLAIVISGFRFILDARSGVAHGTELVKTLFLTIFAGGAGIPLMQMLIEIFDQWSLFIFTTGVAGSNFSDVFASIPVGALGIAAMVLSPIVTVIVYVQVALMMVRSVMLMMLTVMVPLVPMLYNTQVGKQWLSRLWGWVLAFLLYKPVAGLIYGSGLQLLTDGSWTLGGVYRLIAGVVVMVMGIFALPALIRFIVPITAAVAHGGGGVGAIFMGGAMVASNMARALPSGAVDAPASGSLNVSGAVSASGSSASTTVSSASTTVTSAGAGVAGGPAGLVAAKGVELVGKGGKEASRVLEHELEGGPSGAH